MKILSCYNLSVTKALTQLYNKDPSTEILVPFNLKEALEYNNSIIDGMAITLSAIATGPHDIKDFNPRMFTHLLYNCNRLIADANRAEAPFRVAADGFYANPEIIFITPEKCSPKCKGWFEGMRVLLQFNETNKYVT